MQTPSTVRGPLEAPAAGAADASPGSAADAASTGPVVQMRPMRLDDIDRVLALELSSYSFPWTRGNFIDSLVAGYLADVLEDDAGLVGYSLAMVGVDEMHLLNLAVAPGHRRRGHARRLLDALRVRCQQCGLHRLWLEVRAGNAGAQALYARYGFAEVAVRRAYYPAAQGRREDAVVMSLLVATEGAGDAALD